MSSMRSGWRGARHLLATVIIAVFVVGGCGPTIMVMPKIAIGKSPEFKIKGIIEYDGNREFLPRTIAKADSDESALVIRYSYQVAYGRDNTSEWAPLYNPLMFVGWPTGTDTLFVAGMVEIRKADAPVKSYTATCAIEKSRNAFWEGATYSKMRRNALFAVRDNIEAQMGEDREFLSVLAK